MGHILRTDEERIKLIEVIRETVKRKQISIRKACLEAGITDSSYYNWLKRLRLIVSLFLIIFSKFRLR